MAVSDGDLRCPRSLSRRYRRARTAFIARGPRCRADRGGRGQSKGRSGSRLSACRALAPGRRAVARARRDHRRSHDARERQGAEGCPRRSDPLPGHHSTVGGGGGADRGRARAVGGLGDGRGQDRLHAAVSGRRGRRHHPVQCAVQSGLSQGGAGDRRRQYHRAESPAANPRRHQRTGAAVRRCRNAGGICQRALWRCRGSKRWCAIRESIS